MLLLDTNALLWVLQDNPRLSSQAREMVTDGWSVGSVAVSAVTFWEIAMACGKEQAGAGLRSGPVAFGQDRRRATGTAVAWYGGSTRRRSGA